MLVVAAIARIRCEFFVNGKSIKEIVRDPKVSRNIVRKLLRSGRRRSRTRLGAATALGRWKDHLDRLLPASGQPGREQLTLIRLFEELRALG